MQEVFCSEVNYLKLLQAVGGGSIKIAPQGGFVQEARRASCEANFVRPWSRRTCRQYKTSPTERPAGESVFYSVVVSLVVLKASVSDLLSSKPVPHHKAPSAVTASGASVVTASVVG